MILLRFTYVIFILCLLASCNQSEKTNESGDIAIDTAKHNKDTEEQKPLVTEVEPIENLETYESLPDSGFVVMNHYSSDFVYDMKYATDDNFLKKTVYSCDHCLVRKEVAEALIKANNSLIKQGFRIKFYDCYRPVAVQKQMWEIYPNARYVANPYTTGSIHNRGGAVDITLVDLDGEELDMGTGFDYFGKEAHHAYPDLPDTVLSNRQLLKKTMESYGFNAITSEWWHYNFKSARKYSLSDFNVECD